MPVMSGSARFLPKPLPNPRFLSGSAVPQQSTALEKAFLCGYFEVWELTVSRTICRQELTECLR
jgi:hypothetical protein